MTDILFAPPKAHMPRLPQDQLLSAHDLIVQRGDLVLSAALNFSVAMGKILHVQGRNGAGKSTLLQMLAGLLPVSQPTMLTWGSAEPATWPVLYIGHRAGLSSMLSVRDNLTFLQHLHQPDAAKGRDYDEAELCAALQRVGLTGFEDVPVSQLSAGQKRRVHLARLWLSHDARLWLLDEPLSALDQDMASQVSTRMAEFAAQGGRVIFTSHQPLSMATEILDLDTQTAWFAEDDAGVSWPEYPDV